MFTVIICSDALYKNCTEKYYEFLTPFLKDGNFAFCAWNPLADSLEEAVPQLKNLIEDKTTWRALVVLDEELYGDHNISKRNPYNFVDSDNELVELYTLEDILAYREKSRNMLEQAVKNPLTKLSLWLMGASSSEYPEVSSEFADLPQPDDNTYFVELQKRHISPMEVEWERFTQFKGEFLKKHFVLEGEIQKKPAQLIALSERKHVNDNVACNAAWKTNQEHAYSRFFEDNLYAGRMRFLLSDIDYVKNERRESSYFNFIVLTLLLARIDSVMDSARASRVYSIGITVNQERLSECYYKYLNKLRLTLQRIDTLKRKKIAQQNDPIDNKTAEQLFISDVKIPVVVSSEFDTDSLLCEYNGIGLSRNCPREEMKFWDDQYREIEKKFIRYLREPRRAVKTSVNVDLRMWNEIEDERIASLNEFQREEVEIRLLDEEEAMVKTKTAQLFKTNEFTKKTEKANKELKRRIGQRMTKKKTIIVGCVALTAYLFGFLPLLWGNRISGETLYVATVLASTALASLALSAFICLWIFRHKLINCFKHFNYVMSGLLRDIDDGLKQFSKYLSHCCNVMREFSVLNWLDEGRGRRIGILKKHEYYIMQQLKKTQEIFNGNITGEPAHISTVESFDYDFDKDELYLYEMGTVMVPGKCKFLHECNLVDIPVDYVEGVTLTREELYD